MKGKVLQCILLTFIIYKMKGDQEFSSIRSARCRKGDQDFYLNGYSWTKCLKACNDRTSCQGISYRRSFNQCVLNYEISNNSPLDVCPGFIYAGKPFWNYVDKYAQEISHLIACQPTALKAVRLQALVPSYPDTKDRGDALDKLDRERVENLLEDAQGLLTNRIN